MVKVTEWIIDHLPQLLGFALVLAQSIRNGRQTKALRYEVNGKLAALVKATGDSARAEGRETGREEGRAASITEAQARTNEAERVSDRSEGR